MSTKLGIQYTLNVHNRLFYLIIIVLNQSIASKHTSKLAFELLHRVWFINGPKQ